jgi:hypothetical protein
VLWPWCNGRVTRLSGGQLAIAVGALLGVSACAPSPAPSPSASATAVASAAELEARPVSLPTVSAGTLCPTTAGRSASDFSPFGVGFAPGSGPVYPDLGTQVVPSAVRSKVLWFAHPSHPGPAVVRGHRLDAPGTLTFARAPGSAAPVLLLDSATADRSGGSGWLDWPSGLWAPSPGCYGLQVDGTGISETIVFQAGPPDYIGDKMFSP